MDRAVFNPGKQREFIEAVRATLGITWEALAAHCGVTRRAMFEWRQERTHMPHETVVRLVTLTQLPMPPLQNIIVEADWHSRAGKLGARRRQDVHGNFGTLEGRSRGGQVLQQRRRDHPELYKDWGTTAKQIQVPDRSPKLAELIGILLGDGHVADYYVTVTLNLRHELAYAEFVAQLFNQLFGLLTTPEAEILKITYRVQVSSVRLIEFLAEVGLQVGNKTKHQVAMPAWVFEQFEWMRGCVRGLMDTDGGPYPHVYTVGSKTYRYVKINFSSHSQPLLRDMKLALSQCGFTPASDGRTKVVLNRQDDVLRYYQEIGTHNAYHLQRLQQFGRECWNMDLSHIDLAP